MPYKSRRIADFRCLVKAVSRTRQWSKMRFHEELLLPTFKKLEAYLEGPNPHHFLSHPA